MPGFGARLRDVSEGEQMLRPLGASAPFEVGVANANTLAFKLILTDAMTGLQLFPRIGTSPIQGGIVYFPPGRYALGAQTLTDWRQDTAPFTRRLGNPFLASVIVPESVTLWFAPGATLVLGPGCVLDIRGNIIAERQQIFEVAEGSYIVLGFLQQTAEAEWWGAIDGGDADNNDRALQAAVDSCYHLRAISIVDLIPNTNRFVERTHRRSPVTLRLNGRYPTRRTLEVDYRSFFPYEPTPGRRALLLRGLLASQGMVSVPLTPIIRPALQSGGCLLGTHIDQSPEAAHLLSFEARRVEQPTLLRCTETLGLQLKELRLGTFHEAGPICLQVQVHSDFSKAGAPQLIRVDDCSFHALSPLAVMLGDEPVFRREPVFDPPITEEGSVLRAGVDLSMLSFTRCRFDHRTREGQVTRTVYVRASQSLPVLFVDCQFRGSSSAFLDLEACSAFVVGCSFQNARPNTLYAPLRPSEATTRLGFEDPQGTDVFLSVADRDAFRTDGMSGRLIPSYSSMATPEGNSVSGPGGSAAMLLHCSTTSDTLLGTVRPSPLDVGAINIPVTLIHPMQRGNATRRASPLIWGANGQLPMSSSTAGPQFGSICPLVVIGSQFRAQPLCYIGASQSVWIGPRNGNQPGYPVYQHPIEMGMMTPALWRRQWRINRRA